PGDGCDAHLEGWLRSQVKYFELPDDVDAPLRMDVPAARFDRLTITVTPASCAGRLSYSTRRLDRPDDLAQTSGKPLLTSLSLLMAPRKSITIDELYDLEADPGMTTNLIAMSEVKSVRAQMEYALRVRFGELRGNPAAAETPAPLTREEIRKLRSLG